MTRPAPWVLKPDRFPVLQAVAQRFQRVELVLLALAAPFLLFPNRWTPLAFGLILLTWPVRWLAHGRISRPTLMAGPTAVIVFMAVVGSLVSPDPALSQAKLWGIVLQAAVLFSVLNGLRDRRDMVNFARLLILGAGLLAVVATVGTDWEIVRIVDLPGLYARIPRLIRGLPGSGVAPGRVLFHPREVGATMAVLLPLPLAWLFYGPAWPDRVLAAAALLAGGLVLLLSQAVMAFFGLALAILLLAAWQQRWVLAPTLLGGLVLGGWLVFGGEGLAMTLLDLDDRFGVGFVLRLDMWSRALAMLADMPLSGIGLNTFPLVQSHFYMGYAIGPEPHVHNFFLQTALDLGLPGLLAAAGLFGAFFWTVYRAMGRTGDPALRAILMGLAGGALAYLGLGLMDTVTLGAKPLAALWAMFGLAAAIASLPGRLPRQAPIGWALALAPVALVLLLLLIPRVRQTNLSLLSAHEAIFQARSSGTLPAELAETAIARLEESLAGGSTNPELYRALGELYAWQGRQVAAVEALGQSVALDLDNPVGRYAPTEVWRAQIDGRPVPERSEGALKVYNQWLARFPGRADLYAQAALAWDEGRGDREQAAAVLRRGLSARAAPAGLLEYYLAWLETAQ